MKRFHVHVAVENLDNAVVFYERMFGQKASVKKEDYAKWMLEDPRVNFAISSRGRTPGVDHLGIQAENGDELTQIFGRMEQAGELLKQGETTCCYARSEKSWVHDPTGIAWEAFHTTGEATVYGDGSDVSSPTQQSACCAPAPSDSGSCCAPHPGSDAKTDGSCCA